VVFDDYWATAEIGIKGSILEPAVRRDIPVASVNVSELEVTTAPLDEARILALAAENGGRLEAAELIAAALRD